LIIIFNSICVDTSLKAGLDMEMPFGLHYSEIALTRGLEAGNINITDIDEAVTRYLKSMISIGMLESDYYTGNEDPTNVVTSEEHNLLAREISAKCSVLLRNNKSLLPIDIETSAGGQAVRSIVVIGDNSTVAGGGSGSVSPPYIITQTDGIKAALAAMNTTSSAAVEVRFEYNMYHFTLINIYDV
jgi:beta-glucosidase